MRKAKQPRPADVSRAKGYIDRVKALIEQQKGLGSDISVVCAEAKDNAGLDPTVIRFAAREMLLDAVKRSERDEKRASYLHAIGLAVEAVQSGEMSARQASRVYGIGKTSIYKELSVREVSAVEMTADDLGTVDPIREMIEDDLGDPMLILNPWRAKLRAIKPKSAPDLPPSSASEFRVAADTRDFQQIAGVIPDFLKRARA